MMSTALTVTSQNLPRVFILTGFVYLYWIVDELDSFVLARLSRELSFIPLLLERVFYLTECVFSP